MKAGETCVFEASDWADDEGNPYPFPFLEVTGQASDRALAYGKFGYTGMPLPGTAVDEGGNCLSYVLRDTDMILVGDLDVDFGEMNRLYDESGEDAVVDYLAARVADYVDAHKNGLQISRFRRLEDFTSDIDAKTEYRVALRVGAKVEPGSKADLEARGAFDYHFRAQLNDGQWAQKFPLDASEIIPGSGPGVSPGKYPWDSALQWLSKFQSYYTSKVVYFAVTKDTDAFTRHKGQ
jgi:hypothetical protein